MNYNHFKNYAIKYYLKYYPSKNKLLERLTQKFKISLEIANKIILELEEDNIILEEKVIEEKIKHLISKWKNVNYIKINLIKKQFNQKIILEKLNKYSQNKSVLPEDFIINKIITYKQKTKSKNYIRQKLIERKEDKTIINKLLEEHYFSEEEQENLEINYNKLKQRNKTEKQILDNLTRAGFNFWEILKIIKK